MTPRYTDQLLAVLQCFDLTQGVIALTDRSVNGVRQSCLILHPPCRSVPMNLLTLLNQDVPVRLPVLTRNPSGQTLVDLPVAIAYWRPRTRFDRSTHWRRVVEPDAQHAITTALRTMPAPSILIDGGSAVWAGWQLDKPIRDRRQIDAVLQAIAERLGADTRAPADLQHFEVPLGGPIPDFGNLTPRYTLIAVADASRRYTLDALMPQEIHDADSDADRDPDAGAAAAIDSGVGRQSPPRRRRSA
jgi:hypothetical protein